MSLPAVVAVWVALAMAVTGARPAGPGTAIRHAIVVGNNQGDRGDTELRYAEVDARRVADVLRSTGGFLPENVTVMTEITAEDFRRALIGLNARLRQAAPGSSGVLFVFYSGHADAEALHLRGTRLALSELRDLIGGSAAEARVLVVDSCRSGTLTRVKGGTPGPSFEIQLEATGLPQGVAILTSSAAGEDAQESDQLRASVFTHHLLSALMGAADRNADGQITLDEAFTYASERTLATTVSTAGGPQHPTYRIDLGGRDSLTLTWPEARHDRGVLLFERAGTYLVQQGGADGVVVAELTSPRAGGRLAVEPGRYFVWERNPEFLRQDFFTVPPHGSTIVDSSRMRRVEYARVVRKGTVERHRAISALAVGGMRGQILGLRTAWQTGVGGRMDLPNLSLELLATFGNSTRTNDWVEISSSETALSLTALHVFDLGPLSLGLGLTGGGAWFTQRFNATRTDGRDSIAGFAGAVAQVEVPFGHRFYGRADGALMTYLLSTNSGGGGLRAIPSYRTTAGIGVYF